MKIKIGSHIKSRFNTYVEVRYIARKGRERGCELLFRLDVNQLRVLDDFKDVEGDLFVKDCCQVDHNKIAAIVGIKRI